MLIVALKVKTKFGKSYKDLSDDDLNKIVKYLDFIKKEDKFHKWNIPKRQQY